MIVPNMKPVEVNGVMLEALDQGSGEPVTFVHGGMGDECFAVLAEPVLTRGYRLIHYQRRGYGGSARPQAPVSIQQQSADCRALLRHLGVERTHLVGQSYGGVISLQITLDAPELVHSLTVLEPPLPSVMDNSEAFGAVAAKAMSLYESGDKGNAAETFAREVAGDDYRAAFEKTLPPGYAERWMAVADTLFQSDFPALRAWLFTREDAARITQPVLNMTGANARAYFREVFETLQAWLPQAEAFVVPDATHAMMQTNPKGTAERLARFFSSHPL